MTTPPPGGYRIVRLLTENIKRVKFAEIKVEDDGNVVIVSGKNGQGKTSVLDSIVWALGGGRQFTDVDRPIRDGAQKGRIEVDLADKNGSRRLFIKRTFTKKGTSLVVEDENGPVREQQATLNAIIGQHSFDPFQFVREARKDQVTTLLSIVDLPIDLDAFNVQYEDIYSSRTAVGRVRDRLRAQLDAMPAPPDDLPDEELSMADLLAVMDAAQAVLRSNSEVRRAVTDAEGERAATQRDITRCDDRMADLTEQIERLTLQRDAAEQERQALSSTLADWQDVYDQAVKAAEGLTDPDIDGIKREMEQLEVTNRRIRAARERRVLAAEVERNVAEYDGKTRELASLQEQKEQALAAAPMPVAGLSFDEEGLYFASADGRPVPLNQCSDSEQLRVSVAIAVALNPTLRMARVREGSLLDSNSLILLRELADEHNFQIWLEMVDETGELGFVMEDGELVTAEAGTNG